MLDDLAPWLGEKGSDILGRLNNKKDVAQALPAEMELALIWAASKLGPIQIEPELDNRKRPDVVTASLKPGRQTAIEITSVTDNAISGEDAMDAIARQISDVANTARKGTGSYLYFRFAEESGYDLGRYFRRRLAPAGFTLPEHMARKVKDWIRSGRSRERRLHLRGEGLEVEVEHTTNKQIRYHNTWSTMPPEAHSLERNPLYEAMDRKLEKFKTAPSETLRMLFLADVGNTLMRRVGRIGEIDPTNRYVSGQEIIAHFVRKRSQYIDAIVTFSPFKEHSPFTGLDAEGRSPRRWIVAYFGSTALPEPPERLTELVTFLPEPHYEGYQARSLFRQGAFSPKGRGQYLGMTIITDGKGIHRIELPARMLLDLLAGRLSEERFRKLLGGASGNENIFKHWLDMGMTISGAEMAPRDKDEDDDHLILYFTDDPAARPFALSNSATSPQGEVKQKQKQGEVKQKQKP